MALVRVPLVMRRSAPPTPKWRTAAASVFGEARTWASASSRFTPTQTIAGTSAMWVTICVPIATILSRLETSSPGRAGAFAKVSR
jgi:hypothetical protein